MCIRDRPDAEWGQVVAAAVVPAGPPPSAEDVRSAVRTGVGRAAVPKRVVFVPELPTRGPGKVDRTAVARSFG